MWPLSVSVAEAAATLVAAKPVFESAATCMTVVAKRVIAVQPEPRSFSPPSAIDQPLPAGVSVSVFEEVLRHQ